MDSVKLMIFNFTDLNEMTLFTYAQNIDCECTHNLCFILLIIIFNLK